MVGSRVFLLLLRERVGGRRGPQEIFQVAGSLCGPEDRASRIAKALSPCTRPAAKSPPKTRLTFSVVPIAILDHIPQPQKLCENSNGEEGTEAATRLAPSLAK